MLTVGNKNQLNNGQILSIHKQCSFATEWVLNLAVLLSYMPIHAGNMYIIPISHKMFKAVPKIPRQKQIFFS